MMIKSKYLIVFIALLIIGMSVAVAADADDSTSTTKKVTKDTTKIVKNTAVTKKATKTTDKKTTTKAKETTKKINNESKKQDVKDTTEITITKKNTQKSVKSEGEPTVVDITEENYLEWFTINTSSGKSSPIANKFTGDTVLNFYYFPSEVTFFEINNNNINKYSISLVGKNESLILRNVRINLKNERLSISNMNLVYDEEWTKVLRIVIGHKVPDGITNLITMENVTINATVDYVEDNINPVLTISQIADDAMSNIVLKNCKININAPSTNSSYNAIDIRTSNVKFINNTFNINETMDVYDNPSLILFGQNIYKITNNLTFEDNNITMTGENGKLYIIKLDTNGTQIKNNNITITSDTTAPAIELTGNDNTVTDNIIIANDKLGDDAVTVTGENNIVWDNGPIATELTVINPNTVNVNEISPMTVILKDAKGNLLANQEINVTVGDESETISTDASGIAVYDFLPTTSGSADIVFNYLGGGMFLSSNKTVTVTVNEDKDAIIEELNKTIQEQKETIASQEEDIEDLNKIIEEQDDEIESLTNTTQALNNTVAQLEKDIKDVQEQIANNNNTNNGNGTSNKTSTPTKTSVTVKLNPKTIYTGSKTKITATLKDANGKAVASQKISIKVGSKTYTVKTNKNGVATKTVKVTKIGKNKVTATFKATSKYAKATKSATLTVKAKQATKIAVTKLTYKNKKITIKATIKAGKKALTQNTKLTIKVDGKTLTAKKTSKKGKISLTLKKALKNGSHKVQIISKATSMYKQSKVSKTLKV